MVPRAAPQPRYVGSLTLCMCALYFALHLPGSLPLPVPRDLIHVTPTALLILEVRHTETGTSKYRQQNAENIDIVHGLPASVIHL